MAIEYPQVVRTLNLEFVQDSDDIGSLQFLGCRDLARVEPLVPQQLVVPWLHRDEAPCGKHVGRIDLSYSARPAARPPSLAPTSATCGQPASPP